MENARTTIKFLFLDTHIKKAHVPTPDVTIPCFRRHDTPR